MQNHERFDGVLYAISDRVKSVLQRLSPTVKANTTEIRMRIEKPLALTVAGETVFLNENGQTSFFLLSDLLKISQSDLEETFRKLCNNSVFAHENELRNGYIIMKNGNRAGVCGQISKDGSFHNPSSVNIRIAHEVFGCANSILRNYSGGGLLIAGAPGSGKTTVLRDLVRQLSLGNTGRFHRVAVVDSRHEISGSNNGITACDLGPNCDVILTESKAHGIEIALRTMFPQIIAFDEVGTTEELNAISCSFCGGVDIITTAHIGKASELLYRNVTRKLLKSGAIKTVAILPKIHGGKIELLKTEELLRGVAV